MQIYYLHFWNTKSDGVIKYAYRNRPQDTRMYSSSIVDGLNRQGVGIATQLPSSLYNWIHSFELLGPYASLSTTRHAHAPSIGSMWGLYASRRLPYLTVVLFRVVTWRQYKERMQQHVEVRKADYTIYIAYRTKPLKTGNPFVYFHNHYCVHSYTQFSCSSSCKI